MAIRSLPGTLLLAPVMSGRTSASPTTIIRVNGISAAGDNVTHGLMVPWLASVRTHEEHAAGDRWYDRAHVPPPC